MDIQYIISQLSKVGITVLTQETAKTFIDTKIKPIFKNYGKSEERAIELEECLSEYLFKCYAKNSIMATIVFGKSQKTLDDLYIPLTLEEYKNESVNWIIDDSCYDILQKYHRILIIDMAGMGKSTIVKYFACQGINLNKIIPIVIELRKIENSQKILTFIQKQFESFDKHIEINELIDMLNKGEFVIFFDGYDEISNSDKPSVLNELEDFINNAKNTKIVITSREEEDLTSLGEFKCLKIKPLTKNEAYDLIKKYDNNGNTSINLIKRLNEDTSMKVLQEFLTNPLLVSLLYKTYDHKQEIPYKKIDFYDQVYEALYNDHDKTKGSAYVHDKKSNLDKHQFEQVLRTFGFLCLKTGTVAYNRLLIYKLIEQSIQRFGWIKTTAENFLYDLTHAVPFIQKDGSEYKWVHKSFMEYFASCFICYDNKTFEQQYIEKMINSKSNIAYYNVLDFCYEMDTLNFRKYAILPFLKQYILNYNKYFQNEYFNQFDIEDIKKAKSLLAQNIATFIFSTEDKINDRNSKIINQIIKEQIIPALEESNKEYKLNNTFISIPDYSLYLFSSNTDVIYRLLKEKKFDLFLQISHDLKKHDPIQANKLLFFDDSIDNLINQNQEIFSTVINNICLCTNILDYNKCTELVLEIEKENDFSNDDIFDL